MKAVAAGYAVDWVSMLWPIIGGMSLALGLVYLGVWLRRRDQSQLLIFAMVSIFAAVGAGNELRMLAADSTAEFAAANRVGHLSFGIAILLLPIFVRVRFSAGRRWLLATVTALRILVILVNSFSALGVHFTQLVMRPLLLPGGVQAWSPVGTANPWSFVAYLNLLLILVFLGDVIAEVRRRGDRAEYRSAWLVAAAIATHVVIGGGGAALVTWGVITGPIIVAPTFLLLILVLGYELGDQFLLALHERARLGRSESLLRESDESWELAGMTAGIGPWSWSAGSDHITLSAKAREIFGLWEQSDVSLEDWLGRIHPEDVGRVRQNMKHTMANESQFEREYRIVQPDGQVRWITSRGRVERDADGMVTSMLGVSFDMTRTRRSDAMFRAALEAVPNAIFLVDEQGRIQLANARASQLFGYTKDEMLNLPMSTLIPDWTRHPEKQQVQSDQLPPLERRAFTRELLARRRDGVPVPVDLALSDVEAGLVLASVSDITERLLSEHESAQQRTELAHLSRVAMIGEMSSSLAHELNQPLTAIVSNSQAAIRFLGGGPEREAELRETLVDIAASGTRAGEVIRRLRAMLKKEEAERHPLDINQLVSEVIALYRSDLINRGVTVQFLLERDLPEALGDRVQLQQVLLNLVINACDAMATLAGERKLTIMSRSLGEQEVEFSVWDIGPGLTADSVEQVFEPFVTTKSDGMGLGLSVCKTIVKSHGGRIWAQHNDGPGASFHVALPAQARSAGSAQATSAA